MKANLLIPYLIVVAMLIPLASISAQTTTKNLEWSEGTIDISISEVEVAKSIHFNGAYNSPEYNLLPVYFESIPLNRKGEAKATLTNKVYQPISIPNDLEGIDIIEEEVILNVHTSYAKKKAFADISILPIRKNRATGQFEKLVSFDLNVSSDNTIAGGSRSARSYKSNSVLRSGNWYKLSINATGMYKIDKALLETITGGSASSVNLSTLGVFGQKGGMLSSENSDPSKDDLQEMCIEIVNSNGNNTLEDGEFIVFYAEGPHKVYLDGTDLKHETNLYSDLAYVFLTTNQGSAKTATNRASSASSATNIITEFDEYQFYELESENLLHSGSDWYGEKFTNFDDVKNVGFTMSNLVSGGQVQITSRVAARSAIAPCSFAITLNGTGIGSHSSIPMITGNYLDIYAQTNSLVTTVNTSASSLNFSYTFQNPSDNNAEGWLDYIGVQGKRRLQMAGSFMPFKSIESAGAGNISEFRVTSIGGAKIWDVTDPTTARNQQHSGGTFKTNTDELRTFVAFKPSSASSFLTPEFISAVGNQNLHAIGQPDMIIVAPSEFMAPATDLGNFHASNDGLVVKVIDAEHIYNEFAAGAKDASAIRDFMKMIYDNAGGIYNELPQYLLLYGDGSYDHKDRLTDNLNWIPTYQSPASLAPTETFTSDDYFACLDDSEGGSIAFGAPDRLDIAVGRLPIRTLDNAYGINNKIYNYVSDKSFNDWRNTVTFIADDEDYDIHLSDGDEIAEDARINNPNYNIDKIYLDSYYQVNTPAGDRYPSVNDAIEAKLFKGSLILNYTGHGGVQNWAHERIFDVSDIQALENIDNLPLFVTATCEFSRYDNPQATSAGEYLVTNPNGGSIGMITTVRLVYSNQNKVLNTAFFNHVFEPIDGEMPTMGEVMVATKNSISGDANNRKFTLLGDPALKLAYPKYRVATKGVNGSPISSTVDTFKALSKVTITGEVQDLSGNKMSGFNGVVYPTVFDKLITINTLANDPHFSGRQPGGSSVKNYNLRKSIIYTGKASVVNGEFTFTFIVPKDIDYSFGTGKISYYAENGTFDAHGSNFDITVGGAATDFENDDEGPRITLFMNDDKFVFGGITDENPLMIAKLEDESGINTVGNGIGHDITAVIDADTKNKIILNNFYKAELDDFTKGEVQYPYSDLADGRHTLTVKAWDVHNNSSEEYTEFVVASSANLALDHVLNYPNPFTTSTNFMFEHNRTGDELNVLVQIYSVGGGLVKSINQTIMPTENEGYRVDNIHWDGLDDYGDKIGKGVYVYKLSVRGSDGNTAHKFEKLVILR